MHLYSDEDDPIELLAASEFCSVERCACGVVHVHVTTVTLRMDPAGLANLFEVLHAALKRLPMSSGLEGRC